MERKTKTRARATRIRQVAGVPSSSSQAEPDSVAVGVLLLGVRIAGAVVRCVGHPVSVAIGIGIGDVARRGEGGDQRAGRHRPRRQADTPAQPGAVVLELVALAEVGEIEARGDVVPDLVVGAFLVMAVRALRHEAEDSSRRRVVGILGAVDAPAGRVVEAVAAIGVLQVAVSGVVEDPASCPVGGVGDRDSRSVELLAGHVGVGLGDLKAGRAEANDGHHPARIRSVAAPVGPVWLTAM